jgi:D-amino peptidase
MKVFISCDIEGITTTTTWDETCTQTQPSIAGPCAQQMTLEVKAACEGAIAAGASYILVKDAHETATNIDISQLPACVEVIRGWSGHPYSMATGIDNSFDAAMFVGYHSAAGRSGNPLSHTMSRSPFYVKLNGVKCSEFRLYSLACALEGVPTVFLSGDKMLCDDEASLHPLLKTVAVKDGCGGMTKSLTPAASLQKIREHSELALRQNLAQALCTLPAEFEFEVCYKEHKKAAAMAWFPGFERLDDNTIRMRTQDYFEVLRAAQFVL